MKDLYPAIGLARLCRLLGITRQAYYQSFWVLSDITVEEHLVLKQVYALRAIHPVIGGRKLYCLLHPFLLEHRIKMGRDALFDLLASHKLLVRRRRTRVRTTQSHHWMKTYPNLIKNWRPLKPNQLWVSDITYVQTVRGFFYLNLITDAYSHMIVGYCIAESLEAVHTTKALLMALEACTEKSCELIHHSDRGIQYCCFPYINLLRSHKVKISMTESGDPLENALAERINGIIKNEYLNHYTIETFEHAQALLTDIVNRYNNLRPHQSINMLTPQIVHENSLLVNRNWSHKSQSINL
jgi:transposase InsO family protein